MIINLINILLTSKNSKEFIIQSEKYLNSHSKLQLYLNLNSNAE